MFCLLVSCLLFSTSYAKIPEAVCSLSDSGLDNCLKDFLNGLIPQLSSEGIPEVNLQPLDPLLIPELIINPNGSRVTGKVILRNLVIKGLAQTDILSVISDLHKEQDLSLELKLTNPKLVITGKYKGELMMDVMKVYGNGRFKVQLTKITIKAKIVADSLKRENGKEYFTVKSIDVEPEIGGFKVNATNLFNDNAVLANTVLTMVNNLWRPYYDQMFPQVKPFLENLIVDRVNEFTTKIPADQIVKP